MQHCRPMSRACFARVASPWWLIAGCLCRHKTGSAVARSRTDAAGEARLHIAWDSAVFGSPSQSEMMRGAILR